MVGNVFKLVKHMMDMSMEDKAKTYELKEFKPKRSLSQNSYAWSLINEIANKVGKSKEEVHLQMIKDYSQCEVIKVLSKIDLSMYDLYFDKIIDKVEDGVETSYYKVYKPSHNMDTREMSIYLDGIIQEAENLGIPTLSDEQIKEMKLI